MAQHLSKEQQISLLAIINIKNKWSTQQQWEKKCVVIYENARGIELEPEPNRNKPEQSELEDTAYDNFF